MSLKVQKSLVLTASSRLGGNTDQIMEFVAHSINGDFINLSELNISYYDYEHHNLNDDFIEVAGKMSEADLIVLGSPVYWYSLSAQMKTFLDRWSDMLTVRKDLGRSLKGKKLLLISCGSWEEAGEGYELPLKQTAAYLDMTFVGHLHTWIGDSESFDSESVQNRLNLLANSIKQQTDIQ